MLTFEGISSSNTLILQERKLRAEIHIHWVYERKTTKKSCNKSKQNYRQGKSQCKKFKMKSIPKECLECSSLRYVDGFLLPFI